MTILAYTNVELMAVSQALLTELGASFNVHMVNYLNQSMLMHSPHPNKIAHFYGDKLLWEEQKNKVLEQVMSNEWTAARRKEHAVYLRKLTKNLEESRGVPG